MSTPFILPVRIYYEDTDSGGIVYHANYLKYMERARTEWLRTLGYSYEQGQRDGIGFAVRSAQVEFIKPAKHDDLLTVVSHIVKYGRASLVFKQIIHLANEPAVVFCTGLIKIACLNADFRPCPLPNSLIAEMKQRGC